ncbi:hypothetical protein FQR65_LT02795 [Abscondita terminalis]|nr:hypothetical protein FQR65_LT02795 [Abscondita terminalis]
MPPIRRSNLGRRTRNATNQANYRSNRTAQERVGKPSDLFIYAPETEDDTTRDTKKAIQQMTTKYLQLTKSPHTVNVHPSDKNIVNTQPKNSLDTNTQPTSIHKVNSPKTTTPTVDVSNNNNIIIEIVKPNGCVKRSIVCDDGPSKVIKINNALLHRPPTSQKPSKSETSTEQIDKEEKQLLPNVNSVPVSKLSVSSTIANLEENLVGESNTSVLCKDENQFEDVKPDVSLFTSPVADDSVLIEDIKTETEEDFLTPSFETFDIFVEKHELE